MAPTSESMNRTSLRKTSELTIVKFLLGRTNGPEAFLVWSTVFGIIITAGQLGAVSFALAQHSSDASTYSYEGKRKSTALYLDYRHMQIGRASCRERV